MGCNPSAAIVKAFSWYCFAEVCESTSGACLHLLPYADNGISCGRTSQSCCMVSGTLFPGINNQWLFLALILQWKLWRSQTICSLYQAFLLATESGLSLNPILQQSMPTYRLRSQPSPEPEEHFDIPMPAFLGKVFDWSFWRGRSKIEQFHFTWSLRGSTLLLFFPLPPCFKRKRGGTIASKAFSESEK